jgi:hypothetical protein
MVCNLPAGKGYRVIGLETVSLWSGAMSGTAPSISWDERGGAMPVENQRKKSMTDVPSITTSPVLIGWHDIGAHMRCSADTARSRTRKYGLPIYKPIGWNRPFAIRAELDEALLKIARRAQRLTYGKKVSET